MQSQIDRMISVRFGGKLCNITVIQVYALTSNAEEAEVELVYKDLQDLLEITPQKMPFSLCYAKSLQSCPTLKKKKKLRHPVFFISVVLKPQ